MASRDLHGLDAEIHAKREANYDREGEAKAKEWIQKVTGQTLGGPSFWADLKSGVVLCKLMNTLSPGSCSGYNPKPKFWLEERDNINKYLNACKSYGVPSQDLFSELDLSESKKDMPPVLQNIYGLARQAQAHGWNGPQLGVTYYKSVEDQKFLEEKKRKEAREDEERRKNYEEERGQRRVELEGEIQQITDAKKKLADQRGAKRREDRIRAGRKLKPFQEKVQLKEDQDTLFGLDYEMEKKRLLQHDSAAANNILDWIEDLTGE